MVDLPMAQSSTGVEYRAASAIDIALWDLFGKVCDQPVHQMLGGLCRDRLRIYNTCAGQDLDGFMTDAGGLAESLLAQGISAMKIWPFDPIARETEGLSITAAQMRRGLEPFERIRKVAGDRMDIMVEFHGLWNLPAAKLIARELEPYRPYWYEDPIRPNSTQALAEYARSTPVWVCASEMLGSRFPYKDLLAADATHVAMVDLCWAGGLTEGRKIAALAETWHRPFAPHDCIGPVGFVAAIHTAFSQPNTLIQESVRDFYNGWYRDLVTPMPRIENGYVYPMDGPGLGVHCCRWLLERSDLIVRRSESE